LVKDGLNLLGSGDYSVQKECCAQFEYQWL
jgi:hypothetical protein